MEKGLEQHCGCIGIMWGYRMGEERIYRNVHGSVLIFRCLTNTLRLRCWDVFLVVLWTVCCVELRSEDQSPSLQNMYKPLLQISKDL